MSQPVLVLTTFPASWDGPATARQLVDARLAACVTVLPQVVSVYRWNDGIASEQEQQLVIKTTEARLEALRAWLAANHPYEVPELLVLPVEGGGEAYLAWLRASVD
ncbi:MAG: divalent-cation tolerance protein CutA [Vicinamibacterales bacterium]|nr:divalent-cation tolerance protein CutA [Vicinamibacterales bacterium]